ncbi:Death-on-curing family protein [Bosea sp. LC85]|uniref:type II toxin-antitoxin system death-on-curing family toxin n=1 Tax=Bosea sp. LC85 TaxID=1502851 RepID=UPI0004E2C853|nr:type II toxin-antitoxin system death-on-curing family toxin [Bosea sp. LC85]KFC74504.1 Death-on-curing family protein [Bosea sp. LC85]
MASPIWVNKTVVLALHDEQLVEHGGAPGIRDEGLLDSALARPKNLHSHEQADLAGLAACYGYGLAQNHPFVDGNKRTSLVVTELFLGLNGCEMIADDEDLVFTWLSLAAGQTTEAALADWLRSRLVSETTEIQVTTAP